MATPAIVRLYVKTFAAGLCVLVGFFISLMHPLFGNFVLGWSYLTFYLPLCVTMLYFSLRFRKMKQRVQEAFGLLCYYCEYDLRGSPEEGACPECGKSFSKEQLRQKWAKHWLSRPSRW